MKRLSAHALLILVVFVAVSTGAESSKPATGTITGTIVDANDKPAADCIVTVAQNAKKMREPYQANTNADGKFKIENVAAGDYNLNVRTSDGKAKAVKSLTVTASESTDIGKLKLKATKSK